ncbi:cytidylate kinase [Candidatus Bathyarchaeota archaeon]|jgi:cytidylate kinase|nr:cytidylate kinase [Candidatus Bathyarchaeota archaeon]MDP6049128.1 AAA family ATPase [Candidatus Bathyarchaeota archaeon]MDP7443492.1 AAA family ATPase [Candidatus Bathyarchaeota archaeon]
MKGAPKKVEELVITVSGYHGSGRSTQATRLAEAFGLRYVSSGTIFRQIAKERGIGLEDMSRFTEEDPEIDRMIDQRAKDESKKLGVVIDATLAGWMAEDPDIRIFLLVSFNERIKRIANRENISYVEAEKETVAREKSEKKRFRAYYKVNLEDLSIYDIIINTELFDIDAIARILKSVVEEYCLKCF